MVRKSLGLGSDGSRDFFFTIKAYNFLEKKTTLISKLVSFFLIKNSRVIHYAGELSIDQVQ